jgi:hypothetical protein
MKLKKIDKVRYQERRSRIQWAMIAGLFATSLGFAELYRYLFVGGESSLALNAAGVATGVAIVTFVLFRLRDTPYFDEVNYVWKLKQELNRIYRKTKPLDKALEAGSRDALIIKLYSLEGSRQVYDLDDNTLTMSELVKQLEELKSRIENEAPGVTHDDYRPELLERLS